MYRFIFIGLVISGLLGYFIYSQNKISKLTSQNATIETTLESYIEANNILRSSINRQKELLNTARQESIEAERKAAEALAALEDSDLNYLSQQKPELIEQIINIGTRNVLNQIETITNQ